MAVPTCSAVGHLAHAVVEDGVAGDPDDAVLLAVPSEREADHVADDRAAERRAVAAGGGGDLDCRLAGGFEPGGLPVGEALGAFGAVAEALGAAHGRDDRAGAREEVAPGGVEVVVVVVVAQQDRVDRSERGRRRSPGRRACVTRCPSRSCICGRERRTSGSVRIRHPPTSISAVGPPMCVMRMVMAGEPRAAVRPGRRSNRPPVYSTRRGVAQLGSAPALGAGGPGFKSRRPDGAKPSLMRGFRC